MHKKNLYRYVSIIFRNWIGSIRSFRQFILGIDSKRKDLKQNLRSESKNNDSIESCESVDRIIIGLNPKKIPQQRSGERIERFVRILLKSQQ